MQVVTGSIDPISTEGSYNPPVWTSPIVPWEQLGPLGQFGCRVKWHTGQLLSENLDPLQRGMYSRIKSYFTSCDNSFDRVYVLDCSRRLGKDYLALILAMETLAQGKNKKVLYCTAFEKDLKNILIPMVDQIQADCPSDLRLIHSSTRGHYIHPITGSVLRMEGCDRNPDHLRGTDVDAFILTEAGYVAHIEEVLEAVLPQLLTNPYAWRLYLSTPSRSTAHPWSRSIVPTARAKGNYECHGLDECPRLSKRQIEKAFEEFGGRDSDKSRLEYLCEHIGSSESLVVPEFRDRKSEILVDSYPRPQYAHAYVSLDPGMVDLAGLCSAYYDFTNDMLVFDRAEAERGLNTDQLAALIKDVESEIVQTKYYSPDGASHANPYRRVSDRDLRLIADLGTLHGLSFQPTAKQDLVAAINSFRSRVSRGGIRILPRARKLADHLESAVWNSQRTMLDHVSKDLGHFDLCMAAIYCHRNLDTHTSPCNPRHLSTSTMHVVNPRLPQSSWTVKRNSLGQIIS